MLERGLFLPLPLHTTVVLKTQLIKIIYQIVRKVLKKFEKLCKFSLKMSIFCHIYLVDEINN